MSETQRPEMRHKTWLWIIALVGGIGLAGCTRLETEYGKSTGIEGQRSLNGFGVLREVYRRQGWKDRTVARLSERANRIDAIVWTPTVDDPPSKEVTDWFEEWLEQGDKTLIYVLRDYQTEATYWQQAARLAEPEQRIEYRRRTARSHIEHLRLLLARPALITNGWFTAEPLQPPATIGETTGSWAGAIDSFAPSSRLEYELRAFEESDRAATGRVTATARFGHTERGSSDTEVDFTPLVETETEIPLVARVSHPTWKDSQILVVAGGSLLNNFGLLQGASQRLALRLIEAGRPANGAGGAPVAGFLYSDQRGVLVSSLDPSQMAPSGMEMLTVWPLNLVTLHAAILGLVACLILLPIFGRPRRLPPRSSADFGSHVDAVAALMARTSGEAYARQRISEYMVRVRGELEGPWVLPPPAAGPASAPAGRDEVKS